MTDAAAISGVRAMVVLPAAPGLVPALMGAASPELDPIRASVVQAVQAALGSLNGADGRGGPEREGHDRARHDRAGHDRARHDAIRLLVLGNHPRPSTWGAPEGRAQAAVSGTGEEGRWAGALSTADFGTPVVIPALPGIADASPAAAEPDPDVPTGLLAARWVLSEVARSEPDAADWSSLTWLEDAGVSRAFNDPRPTVLLVAAEGSSGHGPKAPAGERPEAAEYDSALLAALRSGDPDRLRRVDVALAERVAAGGTELWPALGEALAGGSWDAHADNLGHPYGVGYLLATWVALRHHPDDGSVARGSGSGQPDQIAFRT